LLLIQGERLPRGSPEHRLNPLYLRFIYEPADTIIARFDNASPTEPMKFIAYYLLASNEPLIELLPAT